MSGPPFSGKGTQSRLLCAHLGFAHVSTGDIIRREKAAFSSFGNRVREYEERGELVPDFLIEEILVDIILSNSSKSGIVIDGFPRTKNQVDFFLDYLERSNLVIDTMIVLRASYDILVNRGQQRSREESRVDDSMEIQHRRLSIFEAETLPAIEYLKSKVRYVEIQAEGAISTVFEAIVKHIENL